MLKEERLNYIISQINIHNKVLSADLSIQLNVSEDTVRRDLIELTDNGQIIKVHGGAISKSFHSPLSERNVYKKDEKKEIARKAIELIEDGMIVIVGGGTTMIELARLIPPRLHCTFFTISPIVAIELAENPNLNVHLIAGKLSSESQIIVGAQVIQQLSEIQTDLCLLGTNSVSIKNGVTDSDWEVVQVKKAMIKCAHETAILSIAEKLDSIQKMKVCNLNELKYLVTDLNPDDKILKDYISKIKVI
ncbi:DeoR/GlpR family DNA-binding transcription regulator [Mucilaginibacter sp. L196]|uniref:DeoR/GlpR family DNA-binding transcription regulator n=1 Tax=Mucilaginibacter sp. L196 TaxID=1641870 RepID=UPI00131E2C7F|nr:DeoR/GlpR family DNA-binding transcription regulator [Mucilaginibacter sp. L196]